MAEHLLTVERLRRASQSLEDVPLDPASVLPRLYPVAIIEVSDLTVRAIRH